MALTPGFKKLICAVVVLSGIGGGIFYYKTMPKKPATIESVVDQVTNSAPPIQVQAVPEQQEQQNEQQSPPVQTSAQSDASSSRGMQFLLNQGQK